MLIDSSAVLADAPARDQRKPKPPRSLHSARHGRTTEELMHYIDRRAVCGRYSMYLRQEVTVGAVACWIKRSRCVFNLLQ